MFRKFREAVRKVFARRKIRKINKDLFIKIVTRQLIKEHQEKAGVYIPEFIEANQIYESFKKADAFDENGYLKTKAVGL